MPFLIYPKIAQFRIFWRNFVLTKIEKLLEDRPNILFLRTFSRKSHDSFCFRKYFCKNNLQKNFKLPHIFLRKISEKQIFSRSNWSIGSHSTYKCILISSASTTNSSDQLDKNRFSSHIFLLSFSYIIFNQFFPKTLRSPTVCSVHCDDCFLSMDRKTSATDGRGGGGSDSLYFTLLYEYHIKITGF